MYCIVLTGEVCDGGGYTFLPWVGGLDGFWRFWARRRFGHGKIDI